MVTKFLVLALFTGLPFIFTTSLFDPVLISRFIGMTLIILIGFCFYVLKKYPVKIPLNAITACFGGYCLFSLISILKARNPVDSWFDFYKLILVFLTIIFLYTGLYRRLFTLSFTAFCLTLSALIQCLLAFFQKLTDWDLFGFTSGHLGTLTHPNQFSVYLLILMPFMFYYMLQSPNKALKYVAIAVVFLSIILIFVTKTRSVWVAFAILTLLSIWFLIHQEKIRQQFIIQLSSHQRMLSICLVAAISISGILIARDHQDIIRHFNTLGTFESSGRAIHWQASLQMFRENPFLGVGIGNWRLNVTAQKLLFWQRPHNDFLWVLAESGLFAFLAYTGLFVFMGLRLLKLLRSDRQEVKTAAMCLILSLSGFAVVSLFTFPKERMLHLSIFSLIAAYALYKGKTGEKSITMPRMGMVIPILFLVLAAFLGFLRFQGEKQTKAVLSNPFLSPIQKIEQLEKVNQSIYNIDPVSSPISFYLGLAYIQAGNSPSAVKELRKALDLYPLHPQILTNLATTEELLGNRAEAKKHFQSALNLYPANTEALINLATIHYREKHFNRAKQLVANVDTTEMKPESEMFTLYRTLRNMLENYVDN